MRKSVVLPLGEQEIPGSLYKYRSLSKEKRDFTADIILRNALWWSPASILNDELDCSPLPVLGRTRWGNELGIRKTLRNSFPSMSKKDLKTYAQLQAGRPSRELEAAMQKLIEDGRATIGVCSLSENAAEPRLWEKYADSHHGICLRFDDDITSPGAMPHFALATRVTYQDERPTIRMWGPNMGIELLTRYVLTKTKKWEYEQEWRLFDLNFTGRRNFPPSALTGIIFGKDISDEDKAEVSQWATSSQRNLELLQAHDDGGVLSIRSEGRTIAS